MHVEAVAVGTRSSAAAIAVLGQGAFAEGVAALVSMRGHRVSLLGASSSIAKKCDIWTDTNVHYTTACAIQATALSGSALSAAEAIVLAVPATAYGDACEQILPHLHSGQTVFIVGAALGAALEAERYFAKRRELSVSIVEISQPFLSAESAAGGLHIAGARETLMLSGRSLNATRMGLSMGGGILNGLVPASNILERAFFDMDRFLEAGALFVAALGGQGGANATSLCAALRTELQQLARSYGMTRVPEPHCGRALPATGDPMALLTQRIIEELVILSGLARLKYVPVPILDATIEMASAVAGVDLRKEARQLDDLGLIGMDAQEIVDYLHA